MAMQKATIGAIALIAVMSVVMSTLGALIASRTFSNSGNITAIGVGVYSDSGCTTVLPSINWGTINPGASATYTIYVKNNGTIPVTLTMTTGNWNPTTSSSYITLSWNRQNYTLPAGSSVQALLTLNVSSSINGITSFTFDITITGTQ
jgi:hypothetical protein